MIVNLSIENFKSFREKCVVSFSAGTASRLSGNLLRQKNGERVVKSMGLYGPNASGKTSILDALYALKTFVLFSSQEQKPTQFLRSQKRKPIQLLQSQPPWSPSGIQ